MHKLTMITVNGRTRFVMLPVSEDGKVRADLHGLFGIARGCCICLGR